MATKIWTTQVDRAEDFTDAQARDMSVLKGVKTDIAAPVGTTWRGLQLDVQTPHPPADTFLFGTMLIVSQRAVDVLQSVVPPSDVEFLPVDVFYKGKSVGAYCYVNILRELDALDREGAVYTEADGWVDTIDAMAIDEDVASGSPLYQLRAYERVICVNEELAAAIERAGLTGVALVRPDDWRPS